MPRNLFVGENSLTIILLSGNAAKKCPERSGLENGKEGEENSSDLLDRAAELFGQKVQKIVRFRTISIIFFGFSQISGHNRPVVMMSWHPLV